MTTRGTADRPTGTATARAAASPASASGSAVKNNLNNGSLLNIMISTDTRLRVEFLCARIERGEEVALQEMTWLQKWADNNRHVYEMVRSARRRARSEDNPLDDFLNDMGLGEPDPTSHLTSQADPDTMAQFFKRNPGETNDRLQRD